MFQKHTFDVFLSLLVMAHITGRWGSIFFEAKNDRRLLIRRTWLAEFKDWQDQALMFRDVIGRTSFQFSLTTASHPIFFYDPVGIESILWGAAAYQLGNTSSRKITEVKQRWARLVLGWATVQVLPECPSWISRMKEKIRISRRTNYKGLILGNSKVRFL